MAVFRLDFWGTAQNDSYESMSGWLDTDEESCYCERVCNGDGECDEDQMGEPCECGYGEIEHDSGCMVGKGFFGVVEEGFPDQIELHAVITAGDGEVFTLTGTAWVGEHCPHDADGQSQPFSHDCMLELIDPDDDPDLMDRLLHALKSENFDVTYSATDTQGEFGKVTLKQFALVVDNQRVHARA